MKSEKKFLKKKMSKIIRNGKGFKCTPWSKPTILKAYKYKGCIIEYIEQSCSNHYSVYWHHEFRALKDGKIITNGHMRYSDCVRELKEIIKYTL